MRVNIERRGGGPVDLGDFADKHGLTMTVRERDLDFPRAGRFYASFDYVDVAEGGVLIGAYGNGPTPELAIEDYARKLQGKRVKFDPPPSPEGGGVYIDCPNEITWTPK